MREVESRAVEAYREDFGEEPEVVASAPGRINLIGEHTDYQGGFVLPCAIDRRIAVAAGRGGNELHELHELHSADFGDTRSLASGKDSSWADYPRGVAWALDEAGCEVGRFRAAFAGDVPRGAGLSSSAAIESATVLALDALFGFGIERKEAALLCQRAENGFVGVQSGILDQYASLMCRGGAALFIDCRSLEARSVPLDLEEAGLSLLVCDTNIRRRLAASGYNDRRATAESAAKSLEIKELRDAKLEDLARLSGDEFKRARHIVSENERVLEAVEALEEEDFQTFGKLMFASHDSMRDDYEISTSAHDAFVELARKEGTLGARLTGGGFGGCAISLVPSGEAKSLTRSIEARFARLGFERPDFYEFLPAVGAEIKAARDAG